MNRSLLHLLTSKFDSLDHNIQKEIYKEFYELAYAPVIYMVKDHSAAEDIIQTAFINATKSPPKINDENHLRNWIQVIVKNTTYNYFRKRKKHRNEVDSERVYMNDNIKFATENTLVEKQVELKMMGETIQKCLKNLKPEYQALIELRWKKDLSYKEIAVTLDTTEETVKYKLFRAREAIKQKFKREWGERGE